MEFEYKLIDQLANITTLPKNQILLHLVMENLCMIYVNGIVAKIEWLKVFHLLKMN